MPEEKTYVSEGQRLYEEYRAKLLADPEFRAIYEKEFAKKELWLQLVEARQAAGLTKKEVAKRLGVSKGRVARIEKNPYACTPKMLNRYLEALGNQYRLKVIVEKKSA